MLSKKRILAGAMAILMALGMTACAQNNEPAATQAPATQAPATQAPDPVATAEPSFTPAPISAEVEKGLSKYDETVVLKYPRYVDTGAVFAPGQSYENNIYITEYAEVLGIDAQVQWEAESVEDYNDKLNRGILSNDLPDAFSCDIAVFTNLLKAGMVQDLTDVFAEWATPFYYDNVFADGGESVAQASVDGRMMGIPRSAVALGGYQFMFVREDWRIALDLPEPKTMEDVLTLARAFTTQDPDGNGVKDTYGIAISNQPFETWHAVRGIFNAFGAYPMTWIERNGQIEYGDVQPEMKTALAAMNSWYNEGIINPEFVAMTSWDIYAPTNYGITFGEGWLHGWPLPETLRAQGNQWRPYNIPFDDSAPTQKYAAKQQLGEVYCVRTGYDHPEALVKMNNLFQDRVLSFNYDTKIYKGDDQYNYEMLAVFAPTNGPDRNLRNSDLINEILSMENPDLTLLENIDQSNLYRNVQEYIFMDTYGVKWSEEVADRFTVSFGAYWGNYGPNSTWGLTEASKAANRFEISKFQGSPTPAMLDFEKQLQSDETEMINNIISGVEPIDYFDEFVSNWWASGGQEMTDEVNEWYNLMH